jgi:hypothetical protein
MTATCRRRVTTAVFSLALIGLGLLDRPTFAEWPLLHKQKVVYATPVVTAQAPVTYTVQAPVAYTAQAPVAYTAQAPVAYTAQAPVMYTAQAPVAYTAQAPTMYATTTAAAPATTAAAPATAAAPNTGGAPTEQGVRISLTVRNAIYADLVALYHSQDSGDTRVEKIRAVKDRAREEYEAILEGEDNPELNASERQDLTTLVDWVISGGAASQRTYYPQLAPPGPVANAPGSGYGPGQAYGYPTMVAPPTLYVPVRLKPVHPHQYKHLYKP